jgi:hypothetical protein
MILNIETFKSFISSNLKFKIIIFLQHNNVFVEIKENVLNVRSLHPILRLITNFNIVLYCIVCVNTIEYSFINL